MDVIPDVAMGPLLTAILKNLGTAVTGIVDVHLYTNNIVPQKNNTIADFTELTGVQVPGYVKGTANWSAGVPFRRADGAWESPSSLADPSFVATGPPPVPITVFGYFLTDSTDAILLGSGRFDSPFAFTKTGDGFTLETNPNLVQTSGLSLTFSPVNPQPV